MIKNAFPYFTMIGIVAGAFGWLYSNFASLDIHNALASEVNELRLDRLYEKAQAEVYFLRDQLRKYPNDTEIKRQLKKAEEELEKIKLKMEEQ